MKEKILVLVRAMPEESRKYGYSVCVAGINESSEWRRLYPFKFVYGKKDIDFRKKDVIDVELDLSDNDKRTESRKVKGHKNLHQPKEDEEVIKTIKPLVSSIRKLEEKRASLGVVKPDIIDFEVKVHGTALKDEQKYLSLLEEEILETREKVKLPVEGRYIFKCRNDPLCSCSKKPHRIKVIDWELNELARNIMKKEKDKRVVEQKIKEKFFNWMKKRDVYFFLGTHFKFKTWMIVGIFYPDKESTAQRKLVEG